MTTKGNFIETESKSLITRGRQTWGNMGVGNVFYLSCNDDYTALHIFTKNYYIIHLHWVNFMVCKIILQ